jgi:YgiT-type zinc finger domain-containing protein
MKENSKGVCSLCGGSRRTGTTTFTAELGFGVIVVRNVPALVCVQCGMDWIADDIASRIEELVEDARKRRYQVEVMTLS